MISQSAVLGTPTFTHTPVTTFTSYERSDGRKGEFSLAHPKNEAPVLLTGIASDQEYNQGIWHIYSQLSVEEARLLRQLLNHPEVASYLEQ